MSCTEKPERKQALCARSQSRSGFLFNNRQVPPAYHLHRLPRLRRRPILLLRRPSGAAPSSCSNDPALQIQRGPLSCFVGSHGFPPFLPRAADCSRDGSPPQPPEAPPRRYLTAVCHHVQVPLYPGPQSSRFSSTPHPCRPPPSNPSPPTNRCPGAPPQPTSCCHKGGCNLQSTAFCNFPGEAPHSCARLIAFKISTSRVRLGSERK
ncbi:hypothetical protein BRADI_3g15283v3 [Brachypodium distachyon]|uniref:Uncharacterized protein n=1 Tax=Brachypodium distachyon TaxID=15368 RepID=A0A2K2CXB0_BRADI|nr:hypothetical protein BRADI_3g15283v3 [Brachypodium distachyon]PNT66659.1 hypothetical protein BRADI_3g15283v3 [Brachypodium distachyon]